MVIIPLFARHRILSQVAGHNMYVIKLLPPLCLSQADEDWIVAAFDDVIADLTAQHDVQVVTLDSDGAVIDRTAGRLLDLLEGQAHVA